MQVETRALSEAERRTAIAAYTIAPRRGCSAFAYYGLYAVLIPMMGGGFIAQILRLVRVPDSWAFPLGFALATIASLMLFARNRRHDIRERLYREAEIQTLTTSGHVRTYTASVARAWEVTDYDYGPAYLIQVEPSRFIFMSSFSPQIDAMGALCREITISVVEPTGPVLAASTHGAPMSIDEQELESEDVSDSDGRPVAFALLTPQQLPQSWRVQLSSTLDL